MSDNDPEIHASWDHSFLIALAESEDKWILEDQSDPNLIPIEINENFL